MSLDEQARQFATTSTRALLGVLLLGVLLVLIGAAMRPRTTIGTWAWLPWFAAATTVVCAWVIRRQGEAGQSQGRTQRQLALLTLTSSALGAAVAVYVAVGVLDVQLLALAFLLAAATSATPDIAFHRAAIPLWSVPLIVPSCLVLALRGGQLEVLLALVLVLVLWFALRRGMITHRFVMATLRYRGENERLVGQLRDQMALAVQASEEKSRFIAAAAHDLRQPLHALGLFAASFEQRLRDSAEWPLLRSMLRAIEALEKSFSAILDISRLDSGAVTPNPQIFPVRDLFRRMYLQFAGDAEQRDISLRFRAAGRVIRSDPQLLERVVGNLIQNALRYTRKGGVLVAARRSGAAVRIEVWDSGIGIPADKIGLIFQEFYQIDNPERDRTRGLGMGLAIVRRICSLLGHEMEVRSTPGRGSIFRVTVPAVALDVPAELQLGADTLPPLPVRQLCVLVIDDEEAIREAMREFLGVQQFRVLTAATIAEAVEAARRSEFAVDVIVSDLRLRGDEDGIQAVAEVRRAVGPGTPAILMTGDTSAERLRQAHESGLVVVHKPVSARQILDMIDRLPI